MACSGSEAHGAQEDKEANDEGPVAPGRMSPEIADAIEGAAGIEKADNEQDQSAEGVQPEHGCPESRNSGVWFGNDPENENQVDDRGHWHQPGAQPFRRKEGGGYSGYKGKEKYNVKTHRFILSGDRDVPC